MLWVALQFAHLSLDILETVGARHDTEADGEPDSQSHPHRTRHDPAPGPAPGPCIALCDRLVVLDANHNARCAGVEPGIKRASAQALAPDIQLIEYDPVREQRALTGLACWALQFTPSVGFSPPPLLSKKTRPVADQAPLPLPGQAGLLLEVAASLNYFGGLATLMQRLDTDLQHMGYRAHAGVAPTATGAWLLAKHHQCAPAQALPPSPADTGSTTRLTKRLAPLPVRLLDSASAHHAALDAVGIQCIGDLLELPRAGLARRFGKPLLIEMDCALGAQSQLVGYFSAPQRFSSSLELLADVEQADMLLFAARRLLIELTGWLNARQAAIRRFDLIAHHEQQPVTAISVRLNDPSRETERLTTLLRERLGVLQLRAPVHTIELRCDQVCELPASSSEMFASSAGTRESLGRLLERLQSRLGREQVQRLYLAQDHRPEAAYQIRMIDSLDQLGKVDGTTVDTIALTTAKATNGSSALAVTELFASDTGNLPRPLWLLREPALLRERSGRPWLNSMLTLMAGPERIETGWWDSQLVQRDYFVAQDEAYNLYWVYRERQPRQSNGWYVHGRFG